MSSVLPAVTWGQQGRKQVSGSQAGARLPGVNPAAACVCVFGERGGEVDSLRERKRDRER